MGSPCSVVDTFILDFCPLCWKLNCLFLFTNVSLGSSWMLALARLWLVFLAQNDEAVNGATGHVPTSSFCHHTDNVLCLLSAPWFIHCLWVLVLRVPTGHCLVSQRELQDFWVFPDCSSPQTDALVLALCACVRVCVRNIKGISQRWQGEVCLLN